MALDASAASVAQKRSSVLEAMLICGRNQLKSLATILCRDATDQLIDKLFEAAVQVGAVPKRLNRFEAMPAWMALQVFAFFDQPTNGVFETVRDNTGRVDDINCSPGVPTLAISRQV